MSRTLADAADWWPEDREHRARLLKRLAERGAEAQRAEDVARREAWGATVDRLAWAAGLDAYPVGYLDELRRDWPG